MSDPRLDPKKLEKLLRQIEVLQGIAAQSNSEHEAAAAAAKIQALLDQYNLELEEVEQAQRRAGGFKSKEIHEEPAPFSSQKAFAWEEMLATAVAEAYFCRWLGGNKLYFYGRKTDAKIAAHTFIVLRDRIRALASERAKGYADRWRRKGVSVSYLKGDKSIKAWRNSWLMGASAAVSIRLKESRNEHATEALNALLVVRGTEIDLWIDEKVKPVNARPKDPTITNKQALAAGYIEGKSMDIGVAPALGAEEEEEVKQLKSGS